MDLASGYTLGVTDPPIEMPPAELKARLDSGESLRLIDVREPEEYDLWSVAADPAVARY